MSMMSMSPADMAAITRNNENDGMFGGNGAWWIIVLLLFGWGRGFGGVGGNGSEPYATQSDVRAAVDQQTLISKLDQQTYGLADSTYAINNTINQNFRTVDNAICTLGYNIQGGFNSLAAQLASCCCDVQRGIDGVNYNMATNTCAITNTINNSTRDIIENQNANSRAILDYLCQDKISTLQQENQTLRLAASQSNQNAVLMAAMDANKAEILRRTGAECPSPAYIVQPPTPVSFTPGGCGYLNAA